MRIILLPFGLIYGLILSIRNALYDQGILKSYKSRVLTVGVGNLAVGGTGKTPFTAYLIEQLLNENKKLAVISRGYGRTTRGLLEVHCQSSAIDVGDEPLLLKMRYPQVHIWVSEKRLYGIKEAEKVGVDVILLDDNFQHRSVQVDYQFMLSRFKDPFFKDYPMPVGRLREFRSGARRADTIIYTQMPNEAEVQELEYENQTRVYNKEAQINFAIHAAHELQWIADDRPEAIEKILAVSGIANPSGFVESCKTQTEKVVPLSYRDHKRYHKRDIEYILGMLDKMGNNAAMVCTEKDWVKLKDVFTEGQKARYAMAFLPVNMQLRHNLNSTQIWNTINKRQND